MSTKTDKNKTEFTLNIPEFEYEVARVMTFGNTKYEPWNWVKLKAERIRNSLMRHINAYMRGETTDPESGLNHLAHAGANLQMLYVLETQDVSLWNRYQQRYETRHSNAAMASKYNRVESILNNDYYKPV